MQSRNLGNIRLNPNTTQDLFCELDSLPVYFVSQGRFISAFASAMAITFSSAPFLFSFSIAQWRKKDPRASGERKHSL